MDNELLTKIENRINQYNYNEKNSKYSFSTAELNLIRPHTFILGGFDININNGLEAWRFFDSLHEATILKSFYYLLLNYITHEELSLIENVALKYSDYTSKFEKPSTSIGINQMLSDIPTIRALKTLNLKDKKLNILEIGGGSSMLGQMCHQLGFRYTNFDVVQSLAVHNISVYEELYKENFFNFADIPYSEKSNLIIENEREINFLPWWHFLNRTMKLPAYDVIIMNHCFKEINFNCLKFIFKRISENKDIRQKLIVSKWGSGRHSNFTNKDLFDLENEFDFQNEFLISKYRLFSDHTSFISFKSPKNETTIENYLYPKIKKKTKTVNFLAKYMPKIIKNIFYFFKTLIHKLKIINNKKNNPRTLGKYISPFKTTRIFPGEKKLGYDNLLNLINKLSTKLGKPTYSRDEKLAHYLIKNNGLF